MRSFVTKRLDVQGLRALCVISVIFYHLDIGFNSGYLGVDLFFVISGYVISNLLSGKLVGHQRSELLDFYHGRLFRLVPALGTVIFITSILSFFLLSPLGMQQNAAKTGIGASLFSSNFVVAKVTENYFALPAQSNPLIHTWSLGVEEQFYLVFPISLYIIFVCIQRQILLRWFIGFGIFLLSLFTYLGLWGTSLSIGSITLHGFYSPLSRAWQFLLGGFAFSILKYRTRNNLKDPRPLLFLPALILIITCLNLPESTFHFPNPLSLIPVFLLFFLLSSSEGTLSIYGRLISSRILIWIGDRSYSLYLWHWPFIVFGKYLSPQNKFLQIGILCLGLIFSLFAFNFIERPFHHRRVRDIKNTRFIVSFFLILPLTASGALGFVSSQILFPKYESGQIPGNYKGDVGAVNFEKFAAKNQSECANLEMTDTFKLSECPLDVLVIGDSHAEHLVPGFNENFPELITTSVSNFVFSDIYSNLLDSKFAEIISHPTLKVVILNSFWAQNGVPEELAEAVRMLLLNGKSVLLLSDVPNFPFDAFSCKYGLSTFIDVSRCSFSSSFFFKQQKDYMEDLKSIIPLGRNSEFLNTSKYFCGLTSCSMLIDDELMYLDMNHLNVSGSIFLTRKLFEDSAILCQKFSDRLPEKCA